MSTFQFNVNSSPRWPSSGPANNPIPMPPGGMDGRLGRMRDAQRRMWPAARPNVPGLDYSAGCRTAIGMEIAAEIDYLDYFEMDGGNFGLAIGDLSEACEGTEKTPPSALLLSSLHALVRSLETQSTHAVSDLVRSIHELFYEVSPDGVCATLFVARYDPIERRLDYCNAGHEPPTLLRKTGGRRRTILLESGGPVVGVLRRSIFHQGSISLQPGDILAAYTGGLTDVCNASGEEWGYRRLVTAIEDAAVRPARDMVEDVLTRAGDFAMGAARTRDMTLWLGRIDEAMASAPMVEATVAEDPVEAAVLAA